MGSALGAKETEECETVEQEYGEGLEASGEKAS